MCIIPWSPLNRSFFEVMTLWTGGMLWSFAPLAFPFPLLLLRAGDRGCREYYRKKMIPEAPEHTTLRTPGASRLHAPQMARALEKKPSERTTPPTARARATPVKAGRSRVRVPSG